MKTGIQLPPVLLTIMLLLTPGLARGATYYVGKGGSANNSLCAGTITVDAKINNYRKRRGNHLFVCWRHFSDSGRNLRGVYRVY